VNYPRAVTHVGITVTDIEAAIRWYREIFGFQVLTGPVQLVADDSHFGRICRDIFGLQFRKGRLELLTGPNGVCVEIFKFEEPVSQRKEGFEYWKTGIFHFAIIEPDIENLVRRIAETGGESRSQVWRFFPDKPY